MDSPICGMMMSVGMILSLRPTGLHTGLGANEYYSVPGGAPAVVRTITSLNAKFAKKYREGTPRTAT
jgi:hypothetical protein